MSEISKLISLLHLLQLTPTNWSSSHSLRSFSFKWSSYPLKLGLKVIYPLLWTLKQELKKAQMFQTTQPATVRPSDRDQKTKAHRKLSHHWCSWCRTKGRLGRCRPGCANQKRRRPRWWAGAPRRTRWWGCGSSRIWEEKQNKINMKLNWQAWMRVYSLCGNTHPTNTHFWVHPQKHLKCIPMAPLKPSIIISMNFTLNENLI